MYGRIGRTMRILEAFLIFYFVSTHIEGFSRLPQNSSFGRGCQRLTMALLPTPVDDIPGIISKLGSKREEWKCKPISEKTDLLRLVLSNAIKMQDEWTGQAEQARGVHPTDTRHGSARADILASGPATFGSYVNNLISILDHSAQNEGVPPKPKNVRALPGNRSVATLWPNTLLDKLEGVGLSGELILGDSNAEQMTYDQACVGGMSCILGAGNFDAPIELLCQMFLHGRVCILKPNPVNEGQYKAMSKILDPLVSMGYLEFVVGGAEAGSALVRNPVFDEIVLTGSRDTYEKIKPLIGETPICAELGGVNPWIFVPGKQWNRRSVDRHARSLAFARLSNNGHVCAAPQVIVVSKQWKWRKLFTERVRFWIAAYAGAPPFYPGSPETHAFFANLPGGETVNINRDDVFENQQRPVLFSNISADDLENQSPLLTREAFCPVLAEVFIEEGEDQDPMEFLRSAVDFSSKQCFGSLAANIIIPDKVAKENAKAFDTIVTKMPFGLIGVNIFPAFAHSLPMLTWGAPPNDEQSGTGFIGNACLFKSPEKTILRAPFNWLGQPVLSIMPPEKHERVFRRLTKYKVRPSFLSQTLLFSALFLGL